MEIRCVRSFLMLLLLVTLSALLMVAGCVEQERGATRIGAPGYWRTAEQASPYSAGVPRLRPASQRVQASDMRLAPAVPQIMEYDSDFAGVKRGE